MLCTHTVLCVTVCFVPHICSSELTETSVTLKQNYKNRLTTASDYNAKSLNLKLQTSNQKKHQDGPLSS